MGGFRAALSVWASLLPLACILKFAGLRRFARSSLIVSEHSLYRHCLPDAIF
jgi:hypothetical protein